MNGDDPDNGEIRRETLTVEEAARVLGISRGLAYELVNAGELPSLRFRRRVVISRRLIDDLLATVTPESEA